MQYAKFPMKYVNITQGPNNNFSHKGSVSAWDNAGKDSGIDDAFAPFDAEVVWKDKGSAKTGVLICNNDYVLCADGLLHEPRTIKVLFWHDNDISDLYVGQKLKQGQVFYQEGTAGHATGNHVHFNVGLGKFDGTYPLVENEFGVWEIKGETDPTKIFLTDDTHIIVKDALLKFKKHVEEPVKVVDNLAKVPDAAIKVGDKVKIIGEYYATGEKVPVKIKEKTYTVSKINAGKVLLKEIVSWVYTNNVKKA